jgi:periplasmic divalent cation tolerance protein
MSDVVLVLTTVADEMAAEEIARALVEEQLAACVNVHAPMTSIYRWKGAIELATERQLVIKTTGHRVPAVEARVRQLHSYDLPEFLVISAESGGADYLNWVKTETRGS